MSGETPEIRMLSLRGSTRDDTTSAHLSGDFKTNFEAGKKFGTVPDVREFSQKREVEKKDSEFRCYSELFNRGPKNGNERELVSQGNKDNGWSFCILQRKHERVTKRYEKSSRSYISRSAIDAPFELTDT